MFSFIPILATLLSTVVANVNIAHDHEHRAASANCTAKDHFIFTSYSVEIPVPFESVDCDNVYNLIYYGQPPYYNNSVDITNWQCVDGLNTITQLWFNAPLPGYQQVADNLNTLLGSEWPDFQFTCPSD
ncbi:hypothetical protein V8E54_008800 [Elaphomyces granulatus]|jgi:hypothetical protein